MATVPAPYEIPASDDFPLSARPVFLQQIAQNGGNVKEALDIVRVSVLAAYRLYEMDQKFRAQWDEALRAATIVQESAAVYRGVQGVEREIFDKDGSVIGVKTEYSDTLLQKVLEGNIPEKYKPAGARHLHLAAGDKDLRNQLIDRVLAVVTKSGGTVSAD